MARISWVERVGGLSLVTLLGWGPVAIGAFAPAYFGDLEQMTREQRIAYLADAYQAATQTPGGGVQGNSMFHQAILPAYRVIADKDGADTAAKLYALTFGDQIRQPGNNWYGKAKAAALADPGFMALYSAHQFPAVRTANVELAGLEDKVTEALVDKAKKGDAKACDIMSTSTGSFKWSEDATRGCMNTSGSAQSQFSAANSDKVLAQQLWAEAARRAPATKQRDVQRAQEVARNCASVGVTNPMIDRDAARTMAQRWGGESGQYFVPSGNPSPKAIEEATKTLADLYESRTEAEAFFRGTAVTPFLTPRLYMALVKPQCGLS
jgi:hypothetical protein